MSKSSAPSLKNTPLDEDWSSHPAIEWLAAHKKTLLWAFVALIATLIVASRLITWRTLSAEKDFFQAQTAFTQFQQAALAESATTDTDLAQLEMLMKTHPELKPKYQGPLAQTLLMNGQVLHSQAFVKDIFKRTQSDHLQLYQDYTQTSLVISQGHYAAALQRTQQLKASLDQLNANANPILYVFNLIRLGMLYEQTGHPQEELKVWEELQNQPQLLEAVLAASQVLNVGQASLSQYIAERKSALESTP